MKILIVCSGNSPDGNVFDFKLHHPFIYEQVLRLIDAGIEAEYFYITGKGIKGYIKNFFMLWQLLRLTDYKVVHAHNGLSGFISVIQPFKKTIVTFHGSDINQKKTRWLSNIVSILADYRIFVSPYLYEKLYIKPKRNYSILPCGVDLETFFPIDKLEARRKLNLDANKQYVLFSSSFSNPIKNYQLARLSMMSVPEAELLELSNKSREEVNLLLNAVDVLLLTSTSEGSPQIIKEAMACNCPIVSTNVGDVQRIINGTENCFVCAPDPEEISKKIRYLVKKSVRTSGCESIAVYDNKRISSKLLQIYRGYGIIAGYQRCIKGLWDTSVPGIKFDEDGISNYNKIHENLIKAFPRGDEGSKEWENLIRKIKSRGAGKKYDCIIGVSGGTDSSYLMHVAKLSGLRPLAVNLDNGWSSDISVKNIQKVTDSLKIDLETYVIDYEEVKDVLRSFMIAGLPWIDAPTDFAIMSILYKIAGREKVKFILTGNDFRSEGKQPTEWTYTDKRQIESVHRRFGRLPLRTFPLLSLVSLLYLGYVRKIKIIAPFNYIDYQKKTAQEILKAVYNWEYYGGHHHENLFTKFTIGYWLPAKFSIDKRIITFSAQVISGEISRHEALEKIKKFSYNNKSIEEEKRYVLKKLNFSEEEFRKIWESPNKSFLDYSSNYRFIKRFSRIIIPVVSLILPQKPKIFFEMEGRK